MKKVEKLLVLAASILMLAGCNEDNPSDASSSSKSEEPDSSSITPVGDDWSETDKTLLKKYCGEVLLYPYGFSSKPSVKELTDDNGDRYLQITSASPSFSIADYQYDLLNSGWSGIYDYNGNIAQSDSSGTTYYEFNKVSEDGKVGYDLVYYYVKSSNNGFNVIQCYNDLDAAKDSKNEWSESEKSIFNTHLSLLPAKLKLSVTNGVYAEEEDTVIVGDLSAVSYVSDNVNILKNDGWTLNDSMSKQYGTYVLEKKTSEGATVYASIYYYSGNTIAFSYYANIQTSSTWPSEFVAPFEKATGFSIPQFPDTSITKYSYYEKAGISYIYAFVQEFYIETTYSDMIENKGGLYDSSKHFYTDWEETWFLSASSSWDSTTYDDIFTISFGLLDEPYDEMVTTYPNEKINKFLNDNSLGGITLPSFDFTSYSSKPTLKVVTYTYEEAYDDVYAEIEISPDWYDVEEGDYAAYAAKASELAKQNIYFAVKVFDPKIALDNEGTRTTHKAYEYASSILAKYGWAKVTSYVYDAAYEDPTGTVLVGITLANGATTVTYAPGSKQAHEPKFYFEATDCHIAAGGTYQTKLVCDMLKGDVTYKSSNSKFTVDSNGLVTASADALPGEGTTITATILAEGETTERSATAYVSVTEYYTFDSAIQKVADLFNTYFNLSEGDEGYAAPEQVDVPQSDGSTFTYYRLEMKPSGVTSVDEGCNFASANLIPSGFNDVNEGEWSKATFGDDEIPGKMLDYVYYNDDEEGSSVQLGYEVYIDPSDNKVLIAVNAYDSY